MVVSPAAHAMQRLIPDAKTVELIAKTVNSGLVVGVYYLVWSLLDRWRRLLYRRSEPKIRAIESLEHGGGILLFLSFMIYKIINNVRGVVP